MTRNIIKILLCSSLLLATSLTALAYEPILTIQYSNVINGLNGVWFTDLDHGWVAGNGIVLTTADGGESWSSVPDLPLSVWKDVEFFDGQIGLIVGRDGKVLRTTDAGASWSEITTSTLQDLKAVSCSDEGLAFVVGDGGVIIRTLDHGSTWTTVAEDGVDLWDVSTVGTQHAWAVGDSRDVRATTDGGDTWEFQHTNWDISRMAGVFFHDENLGWAVIGNSYLRTLDGGATWTKDSPSIAGNVAIQFVDENTGWAVGGIGGIHYSSDGGEEWTYLDNSITDSPFGLHLLNECRGWMVGTDGMVVRIGCAGPDLSRCTAETAAGEPVTVRNTPAGTGDSLTEAWTAEGSQVDATITVTLWNENVTRLVGYPAENVWLETESGGLVSCANGTIADGPTDSNGQTTFTGPFRAGGYSNQAAGERVVVVIDGEPLTGWELDISFISPDYDGSLMVDCQDLETCAQDLSSSHYRSDFNFDGEVNLQDLIYVGSHDGDNCLGLPDRKNCTVTTAAPGPASLFNVPDGTGDALSDCYGEGGDRVDATITITLRDSDDNPVANHIATDVWIDTEQMPILVCDAGIFADGPTQQDGTTTFTGPYEAGGCSFGNISIWLRIDACEFFLDDLPIKFNSPDLDFDLDVDPDDWNIFLSNVGSTDYCSDFNFSGSVDPVIDQSLILENMNAACPDTTVSVSAAPILALYGNEPNPFNPRTTITFDLPAPSTVGLDVFDLRGRRVRTLLGGVDLAAGRHEVVWNGRDESGRSLPSGAYFLRLTAAGRIETQKMALIR